MPLFWIFPGTSVDLEPASVKGLFYQNGTRYKDPKFLEPPAGLRLYFFLFASFLLFPIVQFVKVLRFDAAKSTALKDYVAYEFGYIFLSAFSKLPLLLYLWGYKGATNTRLEESTTIDEPVEQDWTYLGIGFAISLALGLRLIYEWYQIKREFVAGTFAIELRPVQL